MLRGGDRHHLSDVSSYLHGLPRLSGAYLTLAVLMLAWVGTASAQFGGGPGFWLAAPGTSRTTCSGILNPVANQTWCADGNPTYTWRVWNGSAYVPIAGGGGDLTATYILQTIDPSLPNAQALQLLNTGFMMNTLGSGVVSIYLGANCTAGQVVTGISSTGGLTCTPASGTMGGSGTINTLPKFTASTTLGNSSTTDDGTTTTLGSTNVKLTNQVAASGHTCLQVDTTGVITQTGLPCASGFSGTVNISGSNTTGAVVFGATQADTSYTVTLGTRAHAGTPPAVVADYKSKATTGFTVEISAPPGGGNSIDVDWQVGAGAFSAGSGTVTSIATTSPITGGTITTSGTIACATCVTGGSLTSGQLATGNTGQAITVGNLSGDVTTSGSTVTTLASRYKTWTCTVPFGDPGAASSALADDNDAPWACQNHTGSDVTITTVTCVANAGSPTVTPITTGGGATSILSGALTCGTATFAAGTLNGTPVLHSFSGTGATCSSTPCSADVNITTAGGTAKYLVVQITGTY